MIYYIMCFINKFILIVQMYTDNIAFVQLDAKYTFYINCMRSILMRIIRKNQFIKNIQVYSIII